ncbi:heme peroxidase [Blyttiomyces helicus]|uniref:Peroxidase n=1 Tax=Blyttiomyces helicus TaxID=388810 RepID=A0A4P9W0Y3_9FUNG|nr:heme peroxidase [Blyttiomyces helicus]|eukprot:RKO84793.1 heme peroxidase [Blyttiomyces helicus]
MRVTSAVLLLGLVAPVLTSDCRPGCNKPSGANFDAFLSLLEPSSGFFQLVSSCNDINALWLRAAFHDCGDGSILDRTGGADGSLQFETGRSENSGLGGTVSFLASTAQNAGVSVADVIALGAILSVARCGGPSIPFHPGRVDAHGPGPEGRLPSPTDSEGFLQTGLGRRMGLTFGEQTSLYTGSHTIGCVHGADHPEITSESCAPFDSTPNTFDNAIFKELVAKTSVDLLGTDKRMLSNSNYKTTIKQWAASQSAFFSQYVTAFTACSSLNQLSNLDPSYITMPIGNGAAKKHTVKSTLARRSAYSTDVTEQEACETHTRAATRCSTQPGYIEKCSYETGTWVREFDPMAASYTPGYECVDTRYGARWLPPTTDGGKFGYAARSRRSVDEEDAVVQEAEAEVIYRAKRAEEL